jgi:outer membrane protein assembly factor BamB
MESMRVPIPVYVRVSMLVAALVLAAKPGVPVAAQADAVSMMGVEGEGARYWSRWRGPSGQGLVTGTGYPDTWSPTQNVLWKTPVPGRGNSSPIVWGDRIFLTTAEGAKLSVLAFRRSDGAPVWSAAAPATASGGAHQKNGHASGTVVVDGERVYASFGHSLTAFDMNGKLVWSENLGRVGNYHGPAGSPLLYKDRIILFQDQTSNAYIAAFDARTGKRQWSTPRFASVGWGTPVAIRAGARDEIVVNGQARVQAYDPATGRELWSVRGTTYEVIPTPVVGFGLVFSASGRAGPTLAIRPGGSGDVTASHLAWESPRGSPFVPSPILVGQQLYTVNDMASIVTSLDARTGRTLWQGRLGVAQREGFSASPVAFDGKVFFTNDDGETFVVRAGPSFELLRVNSIGERTLASPALVDGRWYIRTDRHLIAIGAR